jgi:hypothetical protein
MIAFDEYAGDVGPQIKNILPKTYQQYYSIENPIKMFNSVRIAYNNGGSIAYLEDENASSIAEYGKKIFMIPDDNLEDDSTANYNILITSLTGATWVKNKILSRFAYLMKICEFKTTLEYDYIHAGDQADLRFDTYMGEPTLVLSREPETNSGQIKFKCLFLNLPYERHERDAIPPDKISLYTVIPISGGAILKFSKSDAVDHLGYQIYFTTSPGEWYAETCNIGQSPVDCKETAVTLDGYIYIIITQIADTTYYFKVTDYDNSYNESLFSNVYVGLVAYGTGYFNAFNVSGNIYIDGIGLDDTNPYRGTPLPGWGTFPYTFPIVFDGLAHYTSERIYKSDGLTSLQWMCSGDITYQYRTSSDGVTWDAWSAEADANGNQAIDLTGIYYFQYRFIFKSDDFDDPDYIFVKNIF